MLNPRHFLRMAQWIRHPPSENRVKLVIAIVLICLTLVLIERVIGWPDAFKPNSFKL